MLQAVDKGYLKTLLFGVAEDAQCTRLIEVRSGCGAGCYTHHGINPPPRAQVYKFHFVYSTSGMVSMNIAGPHGDAQVLQLDKVSQLFVRVHPSNVQ